MSYYGILITINNFLCNWSYNHLPVLYSHTSFLRSCSVSFLLTKLSTVSSACSHTLALMLRKRPLTTCPSPPPSTASLICKLRAPMISGVNLASNQPREGKPAVMKPSVKLIKGGG